MSSPACHTGRDRAEAIERARRALAEIEVGGVATVIPLHRAILERPEFSSDQPGAFTVFTRWIDNEVSSLAAAAVEREVSRSEAMAQPGFPSPAPSAASPLEPPRYRIGIKAPLAGMILELCVREGDRVAPGVMVAIMESMKMEQPIIAEISGVVAKINVAKGGFVEMDADILGVN
jgi:acetyl-CoA/propionyl-CoA carboxylase biotin carboxyl carrier protein